MSVQRSSSTAQTDGPVVVGLDGSAHSQAALDWAIREAALRKRPLRLVHALMWPVTAFAPMAGSIDSEPKENANRLLTDAAGYVAKRAPGQYVHTELVVGRAASSLLAESRDAALIVMGARGQGGFAGLMRGSTCVQVAAHAHCPVVVIPTHETETVGRPAGGVVVGVEGSPESDGALEFAFEEAALRGAHLTAVHAWTAPVSTGPGDMLPLVYDVDEVNAEETRLLAESLAGWQQKYPDVQVHRLVVHHNVAKTLIADGRDAQILVVGSRGRGGFVGLLLGSVSNAVLHHAPCPVAIVHGNHSRR